MYKSHINENFLCLALKAPKGTLSKKTISATNTNFTTNEFDWYKEKLLKINSKEQALYSF